jgi:hypothetical protein
VKGIAWSLLVAAACAAGCVSDEEGGAGTASKAPAKAALPPMPDSPWKGTGITVWEDKQGRQWVFLEKKEEAALKDAYANKPVAKPLTREKIGVGGKTAHAVSAAALDALAAWKPGFSVRLDKDSRVWIFKEGSKELAEYDVKGEPAKQVTRVGAGPGGSTVKAPDAGTLDAWAAKKYPK